MREQERAPLVCGKDYFILAQEVKAMTKDCWDPFETFVRAGYRGTERYI